MSVSRPSSCVSLFLPSQSSVRLVSASRFSILFAHQPGSIIKGLKAREPSSAVNVRTLSLLPPSSIEVKVAASGSRPSIRLILF